MLKKMLLTTLVVLGFAVATQAGTIATVSVQPQPLTGEKHRASNDFKVTSDDTKGIWTITVGDSGPIAKNAGYTLMHKVGVGSDDKIATVHDGSKFDAPSKDGNYYFADPTGVSKAFDVTVKRI